MAQLMPMSLIVSCSSKIQIGFTFLVPAHLGSPGQRAVKRVCVLFKLVVSVNAQNVSFASGKSVQLLKSQWSVYVTLS